MVFCWVEGVFFFFFFGRIGVLTISFVTMMAFARWFPKEMYGTYQFVLAGIDIASIFALSGLNTTLIRSIARNSEGALITVIKKKMKWSLVGSLGLTTAAGWYLAHQNMELASSFFVAAIFLPFWTTFPLARVFWNAKKKFAKESLYKFGPALLILLALFPVIYFTNSVFWVIFTTLVAHAVFEGFLLYKTIRQLKNNEQDGSAIKFGKDMTIMDAIAKIGKNFDTVILWHFLGPIQVAVYSFSYFPIKALNNYLPIQALALPKIGEKNVKDIKKGLLNKFFSLFFLSVPFVIANIAIIPFIYKIFFPNYLESIIYLQALSIIGIMIPFQLLETALVSDLRKKDLYVIRVGSSIFRIILLLLLTPFFGIWGVVGTILITEVVRSAMIFFFFQRI